MAATYSFEDVLASIAGPGGAFSIGAGSGSAEEGISIEPVEDKNTMTLGADGIGMHSLHAGEPGTVTVRLLRTSPVNQLLQALYNFQTSSGANHGQNTILISNPALGDTTTCSGCAFKRRPPNSYAKIGPIIEWQFDSTRVVQTLGNGG